MTTQTIPIKNKSLGYSLWFSVVMVSAPHTLHLPLWVSALAATLLVWRAHLIHSGKPLPKRRQLTLLTLCSLAALIISFHTLFGREVGVTLLILLATLKMMELKTQRDAMALIYLCCFIMITSFFYSQSLTTALYMSASLFVITLSWIQLHAPDIDVRPRLRIAAVLLLQAIPLTVILFVLFPRLPGPLWGLPQDAYSSSGLDDRMSPGSMGRLALSEAVAFRVSYQGRPPRRDQMYWRGPVLWQFDGRTWTPGRHTNRSPHLTDTGQAIEYTVTLEPHNKRWLFTLDMPDKISVPAHRTPDFQILSSSPINSRLRYQARSYRQYHAAIDESSSQLIRALQLPATLNPRARQLAARWRTNNDDAHVIRLALNYFNKQNFYYTLNPPPLGSNGIDDFLFTTQKGFCEHYASSFVFLMRAAGIPARVVTGYQGGEFNAIGHYYIVRQSDAHAWAEVWLQGIGWQRIDPTSAIAPERVTPGLSAALSDNTALTIMTRVKWLHDLRMNWDALSYQWNQWVIAYNTENQFAFLSRLGMQPLSWQQLAINMVAGLGLVIALFALFMLRHLIKREPDKTQATWLKLCKKLAHRGLPRMPHEGPKDYAIRISAARPELASAIQDLATRYINLRYDARQDETAQQDFIHRVKKFPASRPGTSRDI